jgi:hypothetical protein
MTLDVVVVTTTPLSCAIEHLVSVTILVDEVLVNRTIEVALIMTASLVFHQVLPLGTGGEAFPYDNGVHLLVVARIARMKPYLT